MSRLKAASRSPVASTTAAGTIAWREDFTPYGEKRVDPNGNKDDEGFTGHIDDAATGLTYMQARYYDPVIGRFLSNDPVGFAEERDPRFFNRYAYTFNDPVNLIDPDGLDPGDPFATVEEAADDWAAYVQSSGGVGRDGNDIKKNKFEYGSVISETVDKAGNTSYSYN